MSNVTWDQFKKAAANVAKQTGYPLKVMLAQAALETGRDPSKAPGNNWFGIKGRGNGGSTNQATQEQGINGMQNTRADFASFKTLEDGIRAYVNTIQKNFPLAWSYKDYDPQSMVRALQAGGYATDKNYASKLLNTPEFAGVDANYSNKPVSQWTTAEADHFLATNPNALTPTPVTSGNIKDYPQAQATLNLIKSFGPPQQGVKVNVGESNPSTPSLLDAIKHMFGLDNSTAPQAASQPQQDPSLAMQSSYTPTPMPPATPYTMSATNTTSMPPMPPTDSTRKPTQDDLINPNYYMSQSSQTG